MRARIVRLVPWIVAAVAAGCGGSDDGDAGGAQGSHFAGSCNNPPGGFCNERIGSEYTAARTQRSCESLGPAVEYLITQCPIDGRVGSCLVLAGTASASYYRYYANFPGAPGAAAAAEKQCTTTLKGEWTSN